ncbi:MAG: hypothetical protein M3391_10860 [Actinomycetota bacterium]|nr:hypothetical protein [Actinomycetota bacterium]
MAIRTSLRELPYDEAAAEMAQGATPIDLRPVGEYLDVHIPGTIELLYEFGPGMPSRARDCLPLDSALLLLDLGAGDLNNAASSLRGKGFTVVGYVSDAINGWAAENGTPVSTEIVSGPAPPDAFVLDVGDPGAQVSDPGARIPIEHLWGRANELTDQERVVVAAGAGVRAALAVGMLERVGVPEILFWRTLDLRDRRDDRAS